ncbi:MAG: hypothetical protein Q9160_003671 [Pyrenula sp. 1 TL-2023]
MSQSSRDEPFELEVLIGPPRMIAPRRAIRPPVIIALKAVEERDESTGWRSSELPTGVWVNLSLMNAEGTQVILPPRRGVVAGRSASSINPAPGRPNIADSTIGYAIFHDLTIAEPGDYRFRVTLVDMDSNGSLYGLPLQGGRNIQSIVTRAFRVDPRSGPRHLGEFCL